MKINLYLKLIDASGPLRATDDALRYGIWAVTENIRQDMRPYVPYRTGALQGSIQTRYRDTSSDLIWGGTSDVDYAEIRYNWRGVSTKRAEAPKASSQWDQVALRDHGDRWASMFENAVKGRMS